MSASGDGGAEPWLDRVVGAHLAELVAFRRHLHAYPELSGRERETTDLVVQRLRAAGLEPHVLGGGTGLWCDIGSGDGPLVALRGDLDALPLDDEKDVPYRSQVPGVSHACGHDVHTTVVLGAGLALADAPTPGRVRLLFEPAEETVPGGAVEMIAQGALDDVDVVYGLHCDPKLETGRLGVRRGPISSAADRLEIRLHGPGGHTARPHLTVDLVAVVARMVTELPERVRAAAAGRGEILTVFGAVHTGEAGNVIPASATLRGSVRVPDRELWDDTPGLVERAVRELVEPTGASVELDYGRGVPPVVNHDAATDTLARAGREVLGPDGVVEAPQSTGGDSFAWYLERVPGSYGRLGVHDPDDLGPRRDLHASSFDVDEHAIELGVRVLVRAAGLAHRSTG